MKKGIWKKTAPNEVDKSAHWPEQRTVSQFHRPGDKTAWNAPASIVFCRLDPQRLLRARKLQKILAIKRYGPSERAITGTETYFEKLDKSFYKEGIEMLGGRFNDCITLEGDYIDEFSRIIPKKCVCICYSRDWIEEDFIWFKSTKRILIEVICIDDLHCIAWEMTYVSTSTVTSSAGFVVACVIFQTISIV